MGIVIKTRIPAKVLFLIINSVNVKIIIMFQNKPLNAININILKLPSVVVNTKKEFNKYETITEPINATTVATIGKIRLDK